MERYTKRLEDGQAVMDCANCSESWNTNPDGKCTALYCRNRLKDRLAAVEDILGDEYDLDRLRELAEADREGRCVVLNMPRKPLVWGDDDQNACLCPYCGKDLMGIPYGERMVLQCPECGQYLDATKVITREEAEATLANVNSGT